MNFELFNTVSLQNSFHCLSGLHIFWISKSCLGCMVPKCGVEPFLCTPSAPWTNAWKTVWFTADFKPVDPQRDPLFISEGSCAWGRLHCMHRNVWATWGPVPKLGQMPPICLCHETLGYQQPLAEHMDAAWLHHPRRRAGVSSWRRECQQPEVSSSQPRLKHSCKP